jgi:hypothetical protein
MRERTKLLIIAAVFLAAYAFPWDHEVVRRSGLEAFLMLQEYARQHVLTCLIPAFFIAGAIAVFVSQASVLKYFGAQANKILSYAVASVCGTVLAVCSCTILPLFAGIYLRGAGIGPATAFLYSGPAINVLAMVLTAKVLGWELGVARARRGHLLHRHRFAHGVHLPEGRREPDVRSDPPPGSGSPGAEALAGCAVHADDGSDPGFCGLCEAGGR